MTDTPTAAELLPFPPLQHQMMDWLAATGRAPAITASRS